MYFKVIILSLLFCISYNVHSKPESYYRDYHCNLYNGIPEYRNNDGTYTDCLTSYAAIEYDFARKWYECLTQAGHYSLENNKPAICILIMLKEKDDKYLLRAIRFKSKYLHTPISIQVIRDYDT